MATDTAEANKLLVLRAFDTLFNDRNYEAAEKLWSRNYIQHSAHIGPGREGLFALTKALPPTLRYENAHAAAAGDVVILTGVSQVMVCLETGSLLTSCAWKRECSWSIGT